MSFLFLTLVMACSSDNGGGAESDDDPGQASFARAVILTNWADNIIIPSYEAFSADLAAMDTAFEAFQEETTTENLVAFRDSWLTAYKMWQHVSLFEIGPAETVGLRLNMNIYPTDPVEIESHISSDNFNLALSSNRDSKGFPALDYIINGLGDDDSEILERYTSDNAEGLFNYAQAVLDDMTTLTNGVLSDWQSEFRDSFVANDGSSASASVDRYANDFVLYYEKFLRAGKMGIPLGVFSGVQAPNTTESFYRPEEANELFLEGLNAVQDFFNGKHFGEEEEGDSMASYLVLLSREDLRNEINEQLDIARVSVSNLDAFRTEIETNNPAVDMLEAYGEVQRAVGLFKVDMFSALSISVDFVDGDGD